MADTSTGLTLGRYTLHGEIASGGMATVYLGRLSGPVGFSRPVAIKRMHPHIARDPEFVSMFVDEATLAARIQHPNVVPTLDVVAQDGEVFIVMEFIKGESLAALLRDEHRKRVQLELHIACSLMIGVLSGLHAAHCAKGDDGQPLHIVHRDVSPQNILIGVDGLARIVDFGVAKAAVRSGVTRDHQIKGKICYMSPEQLCGHPVDARADVFAASAILWEMLSGKRLFSADDTGALVASVIRAEVPPLGNYRDDVPLGLEQVLRCALAASADARFASAQHFADALEEAAPKIASQRAIGAWVARRAAAGIAKQQAMESRVDSRPASQPQPGSGQTPVSGASGSVPRQHAPFPAPSGPRPGRAAPLPVAAQATEEPATELMPSPLQEPAPGSASVLSDPAIPTPISSVGEVGSGMMPTPTSAQIPSHIGAMPSLDIPEGAGHSDGRQLALAVGGTIAAIVVVGLAFLFLFSGDDLPDAKSAPAASVTAAAEQPPADDSTELPAGDAKAVVDPGSADEDLTDPDSLAAPASAAPTHSATTETKAPVVVPTTAGPPAGQPKPRPTTYMPELP